MKKVLISGASKELVEFLQNAVDRTQDFTAVGPFSNELDCTWLIQSERPHIVLLDVNLPDSNPIDITRLVIQDDPTRIILLSSNSDSGELETAFEALKSGALTIYLSVLKT